MGGEKGQTRNGSILKSMREQLGGGCEGGSYKDDKGLHMAIKSTRRVSTALNLIKFLSV